MKSPYKSKPTGTGKWTIGYYNNSWRWVALEDVYDERQAARRVKKLNAGIGI